jgi:hypothetical protein
MPARNMAESAAQAPTSLAPTASLLADANTAGGALPAAGAVAGAVAPPTTTSLPPLLLPTKSASNLASLVARVVSPSAIRERIGAVYSNSGNGIISASSVDVAAAPAPTDVPGLTAALGRAQREIIRLKDEVAALLSAASGRGAREGQAAVQALAHARHDSVAAAAAREQAGKDLASLVDGAASSASSAQSE